MTFYFLLSLLRWFGIVLLPIVSFSADGVVAVTFFTRQTLKSYFRISSPMPPESLAQARAIDMSIQFLLFWTPFLTLLGWWTNKPMTLLFGRSTNLPTRTILKKQPADLFEVTLLVGACFLVNYVTADGKTNWAEGSILIAFYAMIVRFLPPIFYTLHGLLIVPSPTGALGVVLYGPK